MPNLHFLNFLRPVATVTDKLIRASPYHGSELYIYIWSKNFSHSVNEKSEAK